MANLPLTEIVVPGSQDVLELAPDLSAEVSALQSAVNTLNTEVSSIPNGTYPNLTAGSILTDKYDTDTTPYLYRAMPYVSKRLEDCIVGGTVVWNQVYKTTGIPSTTTINGVTFTNNNDGTVTVSGTASADATFDMTSGVALKTNGKYLMRGCPSGGSLSTYYLGNVNVQDTGNGYFLSVTNAPAGHGFRIYVKSGTAITTPIVFAPQIFNLTQLFGSTIADYVYTLEQATAGSGIAWLKSYGFFTKPYYEYDTGTLKSVNPTAHVTRGVNAWDEEWELGLINDITGENAPSSNNIRSKNYIPIVGGASYYFYVGVSANIRVFVYDANKNPITLPNTYIYFDTNKEVQTLPQNAKYIRFRTYNAYGTTYKNDICINISVPTINGKYFPYEEHTYPLGDVVLRGIPKLVNNELVYDGDIYKYDGAVTRKYGVVDLGTLTYSYNSTYGTMIAVFPDDSKGVTSVGLNGVCSLYVPHIGATLSTLGDKEYLLNSTQISSGKRIAIKDTAYTDAATFKTAMSGVYLVYELATPTTETTTPFEHYQVCETGGTEKYTTTNDVPVGHDTKYFTDVIGNIENIPAPPTANGTYTLQVTVSASGNTYAWV